ncbi:MAG: VOC family protein [Microbacteriaceae bacterium]
MAPPTFMGIHLAVADMARALSFYRRIGLSAPQGAEAAPHVEIDLGGGAHLALSTAEIIGMYDPGWRGHHPSTATVLQLGLESREAVDALHDELVAAGYRSHLSPVDAFWGARYSEVDDPDGNAVGFHSPRDGERQP